MMYVPDARWVNRGAYTPEDIRMPQVGKASLMRLAVLMRANAEVAQQVLHNPASAATAHPQYHLDFTEQDHDTLCAISARAVTVQDFLRELAVVVDGYC